MPRPIRAGYSIPYGAAFGAIRAGGRRTHQGTDYHAPQGTPIYGTGNGGRVVGIGYNGDPWLGLGHNITIQYPDGRTLDAHMRTRTPLSIGSTVGPNTLIGYVGLTGNAVNASPPGSHDHHQRWDRSGRLINPEAYYGTTTSGATPAAVEVTPEPEPPKRRKKSMSTLYTNLDVKDTAPVWALAGDGVGAAGWLETTGQGLANDWAAVHGNAVGLSGRTFTNYRDRYLGNPSA